MKNITPEELFDNLFKSPFLKKACHRLHKQKKDINFINIVLEFSKLAKEND